MTKISNDTVYIVDTDVSDLDSLIGTDGNTLAKKTKNFLLGQLKTYLKSGLSPLTGGVLRFTEISYTGELYANVAALINALDPVFVIDQYHVVIVNLNESKSILKLQDRSVGIELPAVLITDFISLPTSIGATGPQGIQGVPGTNGTNGTNGAQGIQGIQGIQGTAGTNGTNGTNGTDASNNLQRIVTASFTLATADNNYVIMINNEATPITITVPSGLMTNLNVGFTQQGTADVNFLESSTTVNNPIGKKIKGQHYSVFLEKVGTSEVYQLGGNTKA